MSEKAPNQTPEQDHSQRQEHHRHHGERAKNNVEHSKKTRHEHAENLDNIRKRAEQEATSTQETIGRQPERTDAETEKPLHINRELKNMAYQRTLRRVQHQLPVPSRAFSKVIHNPAVETVSEIAGNTVARPSGVLAGGIAAFIGSSLFLWIARHYGYEYNFLLFALLFVGGFFVGLLTELILRLMTKHRR